MTKHLDFLETNLRKEGLFDSLVACTVHHKGEGIVAGAGGWPVTLHSSQEAESDECLLLLTLPISQPRNDTTIVGRPSYLNMSSHDAIKTAAHSHTRGLSPRLLYILSSQQLTLITTG